MWDKNIQNMILFEDDEIIVCRKPAGIPVQSAGIGTWDLEHGLKNYLSEKQSEKQAYVGVVHRLDQPVEGVLVFAKTPFAAKELSRQMTKGIFGKHYLAVTDREPPALEGTLEDWLKKDGRTNTSKVVSKDTAGAKYARLSYKLLQSIVLDGDRKKYLIKIKLDTGRHHQIRVQMANAGMPLVGDRKYNPKAIEKISVGLCAEELIFIHPKLKKKMQFHIKPLGDAFACFEDRE